MRGLWFRELLSSWRRIKNILVFVTGVFFYFSCSKVDNQNIKIVELYSDGSTKIDIFYYAEEGNYQIRTYYPDGKLHVSTEIKNHVMDGERIEYYENGTIKSISNLKNGINCGSFELFNSQGRMIEVHKYNSKGQLVYFKAFDRNGKQVTKSKYPLIIPEKDTIRLGETYIAQITLGNREFDSVHVYIGTTVFDPEDEENKLPNKNDSIAIYKYKPKEIGEHEIKGLVVDTQIFHNDEARATSTKFNHRFVVLPN